MSVNYKPNNYQDVVPYMTVEGAAGLIDFVREVFQASEIERMLGPDGRVGHAEMRVGDSVIMISDASERVKASSTNLYVYCKDTDAAYNRALALGATSVMEPADQFYGDRNAGVVDTWGNTWWISTHVEDVAPAEMERRMKERMAQSA